jgi:hypothetical protein
MSRTRVALDIRPFAEHDTAAVLSLLEASLGGGTGGRAFPGVLPLEASREPVRSVLHAGRRGG